METLYEDQLVQLTDNELRIHNYYFPFISKIIPLSEIEEIEMKPPTLLTGKWRIWGTWFLDIWYAMDFERPKREAIFIVHIKNKRMKVGFTVEDSRQFAELISRKVPFRRPV